MSGGRLISTGLFPPVGSSTEQFHTHAAISRDRLRPVLQVEERGVWIDAEQVEGRGQDILRRYGQVLDFSGQRIGLTHDTAAGESAARIDGGIGA